MKKKYTQYTDEQLAAYIDNEHSSYEDSVYDNKKCMCRSIPTMLDDRLQSFKTSLRKKQPEEIEINDIDTMEILNVSRHALKLFKD